MDVCSVQCFSIALWERIITAREPLRDGMHFENDSEYGENYFHLIFLFC